MRISNFTSASLGLALCLAAVPAAAQDEPLHGWWDRDARPAVIDDLQVDVDETPYFDTWDWWLWLDNGDFMFVQYVVSSFGFGIERQGSIKGIYVRAGEQTLAHGPNTDGVYRARRGFSPSEWSAESDGFAIAFDDCEMEHVDGGYRLAMHDDTLSVEVTVTPEVDLFRPGDGQLNYGWDRHAYYDLTVLPRFTFEGQTRTRLRRSHDEEWVDVSGVGYAEHNRMNRFPFDIARRWSGFRALRADGLTLIWDDVLAPAGLDPERAGWVLVALGDEVLFVADEVTVQTLGSRQDEATGHSYPLPQSYAVRASNGDDWVQLQVQSGDIVVRENPLAILPPIVQAVLAQQMIPSDYEMRADYEAWVHIGGHTAQVAGAGWQTFNFTR